MSLKFVGYQLLQTEPVSLLTQVPEVSLSFSIRINADCDLVRSSGVVLFGDESGSLSVILSKRGQLRIVRPSAGIDPAASLDLEPGRDYHVASVWDGQTHRSYLNGFLVREDHRVTPPVPVEGRAPTPFRLGSDSTGVDVTLGDLTLWCGHALTAQEAQDLGQGAIHSRDIQPRAIALRWSLAGPDGQEAQVGDPGLSDASSRQVHLTTLKGTPPAYLTSFSTGSGATIGSVQVAPSGQSITVSFVDGNGAPSPVQSILPSNDLQNLSVIGLPAGSSFTLGFGGQTTGSIPIYNGPPPTSATFSASITPGSYDIAATWETLQNAFYNPNGYYNTNASRWEIFDGPTSLGAVVVDETQAPAGLTDSAGNWHPLGTYTFTGTTLTVVVSAPASSSTFLAIDGLRFVAHGGSSPQYIDDAYGGAGTCTKLGAWNVYPYSSYDGTLSTVLPTGTTPTLSILPSTVQAALSALGNVPANSVSVTAGSTQGSALVQFVGSLGNLAQPTLTTSNSAIAISHDGTDGSRVGGQFPSITINGGSPILLEDPLWATYQHWINYPLFSPIPMIHPGDVVTFSAEAGFASTAQGPAPAQANVSVTNLSGGSSLPAFVANQKTMRVGYNVQGEYAQAPVPILANLASRCCPASGLPTAGTPYDANFYPTSFLNSSANVTLAGYSQDFGTGLGLPNAPRGTYTLLWDGPDNVAIVNDGSTTATENTSLAQITGAANNMRVYDVEDSTLNAPQVVITITSHAPGTGSGGSSPLSLQNLRVYPPGINPTNPPRFSPQALAMLAGVSCIRFLDAMGTNGSATIDYTDFPTTSWLSPFNSASSHVNPVAISSIAAYTGSDAFFTTNNQMLMLVTTANPHGLQDGWPVGFSGAGTATCSNGNSIPFDSYQLMARVISSTSFIVAPFVGSPGTMTNTLSQGSTHFDAGGTGNYGGRLAFLDCISLCNTVGADLWINIPHLATNACVTSMAQAIATGLNPGLKVHVEYSNECWNYSFIQNEYCGGMSRILNGANSDFSYFYILRASQVHTLFTNAFTAAGRATTDVRRVFGTQPGGTLTTEYCSHATAFGVTFDEVASADYFNNDYAVISQPQFESIYDQLSTGQVLDLMELNIEFGGWDTLCVSQIASQLTTSGFPNVQVVQYEGGPQQLLPNGSASSANADVRNHAVHRHTRFFGIFTRFLQKLQDAGSSLFNQYILSGGQNVQGTPQMWASYVGYGELAGTGDPTQDTTNNTSPESLLTLRSEVGGAMSRWTKLTKPPQTNLYNPVRNGTIKTTGLSRGLLRPTR